MKPFFWLFASIFALVFIASFALAQEKMLTVDNSAFKNPSRPPAIFNHDTHNELAKIDNCNVCHHVYKNGKLDKNDASQDVPCSSCHLLDQKQNVPNLIHAFHTRCKGCHQKSKKGPLMCGQCHKK